MNFGFLGSGKMASAIVLGALQSGAFRAEQIRVSDSHAASAEKLARDAGVEAVAENAELCRRSDAIVLCVKPNDAVGALRALSGDLRGKLLISIVAGLEIETLQEAAGGGDVRVIRVMPNTPALVHKGAAAYSMGAGAKAQDADAVEQLFSAVGTICQVKESLLDVVTGLSGSGPAYGYMAVEALADGGVLMGLPRDLALRLAAQTMAGAAEMILQTGQHPGVLRDMVASPGGTTIAGIEALEAHGFRSALISAVRAATERAQELGSK